MMRQRPSSSCHMIQISISTGMSVRFPFNAFSNTRIYIVYLHSLPSANADTLRTGFNHLANNYEK